MFLTLAGMQPVGPGEAYAVWIVPATQLAAGGYQLLSGGRPQLLGVVRPSPGTGGRVSLAVLLPQSVGGAYKMLITLQPRSGLRRPGTVVLSGFVSL
jgi:hypothetical protein